MKEVLFVLVTGRHRQVKDVIVTFTYHVAMVARILGSLCNTSTPFILTDSLIASVQPLEQRSIQRSHFYVRCQQALKFE